MDKRYTYLIPFFFLLFIPTVSAGDSANVDLNGIPTFLAQRLNVSLFVAQLLSSLILLLICVLPIAILKFGRHGFMAETIVGLGVLCFCTAVGWFPVYVMILLVLITTLMLSDKIKEVFT